MVAVGHGHSDGRRCHVELFQTYIQDVIQHLEEMRREHPELPIFLMGHSMVHACSLVPRLYLHILLVLPGLSTS